MDPDEAEQGDLFDGTEFAPPPPATPAPAVEPTPEITRRTAEGMPRRAPARGKPVGDGQPLRPPENPPLAERMRPGTLDDLIGMDKLVGPESLLRRLVERREPVSLIFWGPPGSGKTTLARILMDAWGLPSYHLSAVTSGLPEARMVFAQAQETLRETGQRTVVFVDEIHRFNRAQQDAFLPYVETGTIVLIGATTENPSFSVITPLLSRCRMLVVPPHEPGSVEALLRRALSAAGDEVAVDDDALEALVWASEGDARRALNALDAALAGAPSGHVDRALALEALGGRYQRYEKAGESYFNMISSLHKSLRGSDPDAAVYWLTRLIEAGEDPLVAGRRMIAMAAEDIGMADPRALQIAVAAFQAYQVMGSPEGDLALTQAAVYLACAPKSNASAKALWAARALIEEHGSLPVPMHLRNPVTSMMKQIGYGKGYAYPHDHEGAHVRQSYLPTKIADQRLYEPSDRGEEADVAERLRGWRGTER